MRIVKYFMGCLTALFFLQAFVACSDDDDNGPAFSKDGKRLVRSITYDGWEAEGEKGVYYFKYNGEGQMIRVELRTTYASDEDERTYTDTEYYTYSLSGNKLTAKYVYNDSEYPEDSEHEEGVFTLNEDGFVAEGEIRNDYEYAENSYAYRCFYNDDRQLIRTECPAHNATQEYFWENGNYVRIRSGLVFTYTYYDIENKTNIDFGSILYGTEGLGDDDLYLNIAGYLGKTSRNLLKSTDYTQYSYEFDEEGYVTKVTETSRDTRWTYTISYN